MTARNVFLCLVFVIALSGCKWPWDHDDDEEDPSRPTAGAACNGDPAVSTVKGCQGDSQGK